MSRIYWDSMLFIYWLEENPDFAKRVTAIHARMRERDDQLISSAFTLGEVLAGAYRRGAVRQINQVRKDLLALLSEVVSFTTDTADHYARIRGRFASIGSGDAIHLACAASAGIDLFLTNDKNLVGRVIPGIQFIAGIDSNIL